MSVLVVEILLEETQVGFQVRHFPSPVIWSLFAKMLCLESRYSIYELELSDQT